MYLGWLVMGLLQLALVGCGEASGDQLLSQGPTNSTQESNNEAAGTMNHLPVRISRAIFEKPVSAQYAISGQARSGSSNVYWDEEHPDDSIANAPVNAAGEKPIAVFDNHTGCAEFTNVAPLQLCFTIQSDVSSLTLNADQMRLAGWESITDSGCISEAKFIKATKTDNHAFTVTYQLKEASDPRCAGQGGTLNLSVHST
jgi:hypothetical protein